MDTSGLSSVIISTISVLPAIQTSWPFRSGRDGVSPILSCLLYSCFAQYSTPRLPPLSVRAFYLCGLLMFLHRKLGLSKPQLSRLPANSVLILVKRNCLIDWGTKRLVASPNRHIVLYSCSSPTASFDELLGPRPSES